jgi:hypothetical protein
MPRLHNPSVIKTYTMTCDSCGFTSNDQRLMDNHSCDVQSFGGRCEDYPCCGHELGDCNGQLYGSDEAIKEEAYRRMQMEDEGYYFDDDYR